MKPRSVARCRAWLPHLNLLLFLTCGLSGQPEWAYRREAPYQREARRRLVTPIYHAEASAQAEALATATTGS
jgi:hypothetical protein